VLIEHRDEIVKAIEGRRGLVPVLEAAAERFSGIEIDRSEEKPIIGATGEFYVRTNDFSNQNVVEQIEALGGEVWMAPVFEWFLYRNVRRDMRARVDNDWWLRLKNSLMDRVMRQDEHAYVQPFADLLRNAFEPSSEAVLDMAGPYIHRSFEGEGVMTVGKAIDFADKGLAGIVTIMPFTCMPGTVSDAIMRLVKKDRGGIPTLNMVYDGSEQATALTRLEAFMYSAREYMRSHPRKPDRAPTHH